VLGMNTFGLSAPLKVVSEHFGFTPEKVAEAAKKTLGR
jgi:transketolase